MFFVDFEIKPIQFNSWTRRIWELLSATIVFYVPLRGKYRYSPINYLTIIIFLSYNHFQLEVQISVLKEYHILSKYFLRKELRISSIAFFLWNFFKIMYLHMMIYYEVLLKYFCIIPTKTICIKVFIL